MGMFGFACGRCWERDCNCTPAEMEAYYKQAEINRNTPIKRETPTLDGLKRRINLNSETIIIEFSGKESDLPKVGPIILAEQIKYSGLARDWNAEPELNPEYKEPSNAKIHKDDYLRRMLVVPIYKNFPGEHTDKEPEPGPIILVSTSGDDYEVLNKVNFHIKEFAVENLPVSEDLDAALGPNEETLTPQNKQWILKALLFKPVGKYKWSHPVLGDESIFFDINTDPLVMIISRVFKEGYKNANDPKKQAPVIQMQTLPNRA